MWRSSLRLSPPPAIASCFLAQVVGADAVIGLAVGLQVAVLVAVGAGEGDVGKRLAAGGLTAACRHAEQAPGLGGGHGVESLAQAGEQVGQLAGDGGGVRWLPAAI